MTKINFSQVENSYDRIKDFIINTEIIINSELNDLIGAEIYFKCDNFQKTNSFKARGAFNSILSYKEKYNKFPEKIVVSSSGNHAQAISYACKEFGIKALIYMAKNASKVKIEATKSHGAEVVICDDRKEANDLAEQKINEGYVYIHPSANEEVILGQATCCYEALKEIGQVDSIFVPLGGGGLASGTYLATQLLSPESKIIACEPEIANDAAISVKQNKIFSFNESPNTIADGARTLSVMPICFEYLKKLEQIIEVSEDKIEFFQQEFYKKTNISIEPTSALTIAGAAKYLKEKPKNKQKILIIISGGNL